MLLEYGILLLKDNAIYQYHQYNVLSLWQPWSLMVRSSYSPDHVITPCSLGGRSHFRDTSKNVRNQQ
jgi:hypothetical protein